MARLGAGMTTRGEVIPVEEHLARTAAVTRDDVHAVLHEVLATPGVLSVVGPFEERRPRSLAPKQLERVSRPRARP